MERSDVFQKTDMVNRPPHYNMRSVECIDFTREMDFSSGSAFKYAWRIGAKDEVELEEGKMHWYVRDVLVHQKDDLRQHKLDLLLRKLSVIRDEFREEIWSLLMALLYAASGDQELLLDYAKNEKVLKPLAHEAMFG